MRFRGRWYDGHNDAHVSHNALELKPPRLNSSPTSTRLYNNRTWIVPEVAASHARVLKVMNAAAMGIVNSLQCNADRETQRSNQTPESRSLP